MTENEEEVKDLLIKAIYSLYDLERFTDSLGEALTTAGPEVQLLRAMNMILKIKIADTTASINKAINRIK
jgi:hypothetical protein